MVLSTSSPISGDATELFVFSDVGSKIILPSASLLFKGDYERDGPDLLVSMNGEQTVRVVDYFTHADAPALYATDGTSLKGTVVESLAGPLAPGQYAQSGATATAGAIGQVEELSGTATVQRADGTSETLQVGSKVFQNDVVQTADGSKVSLTFVDGTIFTLASASRMILDELIYDPNSTENSGIFNLVEGSFVFIAGQAAKTGGLEINTPAATMGIRGTTVRVDIVTVDGKTTVEVSLNRDPDGETGIFTLTDLDGNEIATIDSTESKWIVSPVEGETREVERSSTDLDSDQVLITDAVNAFQSATQRVQQGGNFVENNGPNEQQDTAPDEGEQNDAPDNGAPEDTQEESGNEEQDRSQLDSSGIETDLASFDGDDLDSSVDIPDLESGDVGVDGFDGGQGAADQASADGDNQLGETFDDPVNTPDAVNNDLAINLPTLTTSVAEDGSIGISGFSINGPAGGTAIVTLVAGSTVTLAPGSGVTILSGTGTDDVTVQIEGTFDQLNAALNGDGTGPSLVYAPSPDADDFGTLDITVEFDGQSVSSQLVIDIVAEQDAPVASAQTVTTDEDTAANGQLIASDVDTGDTLTFSADSMPANGSVVVNADGSFTFTPNANFNGTDNFNFIVDDGNGGTATETVTVTVNSVNDVPVASSQTVTTDEDVAAMGQLVATDVDGDTVTFSADGTPSNGSAVVNTDGSFTFTPNADFNGAGSFDFIADDGNGGTATETVTVTVSAVNDDPVASSQTVTTDEDVAASGQLVATDVDGDTVTFSADGTPSNGSVVVNTDGSFTFTPNADFNGAGSFDFIADDGNGGTATETVNVTVSAVNDDPTQTGLPTDVSVNENTESNVDLSGFTLADVDSADHIVTITVDTGVFTTVADGSTVSPDLMVNLSTANFQTISLIGTPADINTYLNNSANITYTGPAGLSGGDAALITVFANDGDGSGAVELGTVNLDIAAANSSPIITTVPSDISVAEDTLTDLNLSTIEFGDVDGDELTVTLSVDNGMFAPPSEVGASMAGVSASIDGPMTSITIVGDAANIEAFLDTASNIQYQGALNANGDNAALLTVSVSDGITTPASDTINIDITAVNDAPVFDIGALPSPLTVNEDTFTFLSGLSVSDVDAGEGDVTVTLTSTNGFFTINDGIVDGLIASQITNNASGSVTLIGSVEQINATFALNAGVTGIRFQGNQDVNGAGTITFAVDDGGATGSGGAMSDSVTINTNILAENDAPTAVSVPVDIPDISVAENTASNVDLSSVTFADVDGDQLTVTLSVDAGTFETPAMGAGLSVALTNPTTITISGSASDITAYFDTPANIQYTGPVGVSGDNAAVLSINVNDGTVDVPAGPVNIDISTPNAAPSFNLNALTASELVTNGDFETTGSAVSTGENVVAVGAPDITGFTVSGAPVSIVSGGILDGDGNAIRLELVGNSSPTGTISQTIETIVGRTYEVSVTSSEPSNSTNGVLADVFVDNTAGDSQVQSGGTATRIFRFVATDITTTVSVAARPSASSFGGRIVDNLSVTEVRPDNTFVAQEGASTSLEGIVIDDDSVSSANFSVTLTVASGTLSDTNGSSPVIITGSGTNTLVLTGTLADINSEIAGGFVTYDGAAGFRGLDTLTITADDGDTASGGGAQSFTQTVDVVVGNTDSIIVGTDQADNNVGNGQDNIIFSLDSTNGTDLGNLLNGNDVYIGGAGQEDVDGQDGDDFIFGAGGNDTLEGSTGNDTLLGGDGNDILMDRAGEAGTYDGGAGQDTFFVTNAGAVDLTAAGNGSFTSIETLNISNSEVNTLTLDETNIFNLSETSNITVEGLLGGASLPESILINAEAGDTVNFELDDAGTFEYNIGTSVGGFNIVELLELGSGDVRGTVAISNTATLVVEGINNAPVVTTDMVTTDFLEGDPSVVVNNTIEVSDADGDMITGATVSVSLQSGVFQEGDILLFTDTASITGSYNDTTGVLTLNGTDTAANYQAALRSVQFRSFNQDLNDLLRDVDFVVNDGTDDSTVVTSIINPTSINNAPTIDTSDVRGLEIVANGSFETPDIGVGSSTLSSGSTAITGFTVGDGANVTTGTGNINLTSFLNAPEGDQVIDLDGETAGAITTTLTTEIGATYEVSFQYAGNPGSDNGVRSANVIVGGQSQTISFDTAPFNTGNLVYQTQTIVFTAIATTTGLTFESLSADGSDAGILIDGVSVREVTSTGVGVGLGGNVTFSDLVFADPDGDPTNATVVLGVANGTLTLGVGSTAGITVGGDGTGTLTLSGNLSTINAYFENDDALTYANTSGVDGDVDNLSISVNDGGSFGIGVAQSASTSIPITLGSNTIAGTSANNTLSGGAGADVIEGLAGNDVLNGLGGNDVLIGGDGDDTLNGGDGDDFLNAGSGADSLFGNDGNDTLQSLNAFGIDTILDGGAGDDSIFVDDFATNQIDGGTGRDELRYFQSGNIDLRSTGINIDGVEALSIENGETNTLFLDLARLQGLSTDSDTELETLLDQALTNGRTILGDAGDTVDVEVDAGFTFTQNTALSADLQDDNGNQLDVFEFVETSSGDVFATVAIEEQVSVVTS